MKDFTIKKGDLILVKQIVNGIDTCRSFVALESYVYLEAHMEKIPTGVPSQLGKCVRLDKPLRAFCLKTEKEREFLFWYEKIEVYSPL